MKLILSAAILTLSFTAHATNFDMSGYTIESCRSHMQRILEHPDVSISGGEGTSFKSIDGGNDFARPNLISSEDGKEFSAEGLDGYEIKVNVKRGLLGGKKAVLSLVRNGEVIADTALPVYYYGVSWIASNESHQTMIEFYENENSLVRTTVSCHLEKNK